MKKDDLVYIRHMLDSAEKAARKVEGITREDFDRDEKLQLAIVQFDSNARREP